MGSGLILLLIVGAWLAVLVPMALRSHDASTSLGTVDRFHDAMRVLSRRDAAARARDRAVVVPRRPAPATAPAPTGLTPAQRRRRALLVLVAVAVLSLVGAVVGPLWLLAVHATADLLLLGFLVWLRQQAVLRAEREWRAAMGARRTAAQVRADAARARSAVPVRVAGVPDRMPARAALEGGVPVAAPAPVRAARYEDPAPAPAQARGAQGAPWQPVPVPVPTYVNAPVAPRRVLDLTRSGEYAETLADAERSLGIDDRGPDLDEILDRRRAVGD